MAIYVECADEAQGKNTGAVSQCLEAITVRHVLAPLGQQFDTRILAKSLSEWKDQIAAKNLIPLFDAENMAIADTEPTFEETRKQKLKVTEGKKVRTFEYKLGMCSHAALTSFDGKRMQVYEITEDNELLAVSKDGITVTGQTVIVEVGMRKSTLADKKAHTMVTLSYVNFRELEQEGQLLSLPFFESDVMGIFDAQIEQVSASATSVKFKVLAGCADTLVTSITNTDITFKTSAGVDVVHTFVAADSNGVYTLTGTGFVTGNLLNLNGVVQQTEATYESIAPLSIIVT